MAVIDRVDQGISVLRSVSSPFETLLERKHRQCAFELVWLEIKYVHQLLVLSRHPMVEVDDRRGDAPSGFV